MWSSEDFEALRKNAFQVCQKYLEGPWQDTTLKDFEFSVVSGGLSNRLYHCSLPEDRKAKASRGKHYTNQALLRIYGPIQDDVSVILREACVFTLLSEKGMGPKLFGIFADGRLEEFIPSRSCNREDIRKNAATIARELAKVHCLSVPISKHPTILTVLAESWFRFVEENLSSNKCVVSLCEPIIRNEYRKEMRWLNEVIESEEWPVVFCHNDLQGGNILLREDKTDDEGRNSLLLIDFEFGCYNYRGFDIANHFCEWCFNYNTKEFPHFEVDLSRFPNDAEQAEFIEAYLKEADGQICGSTKESILQEIMVFRMASSLLWTLWSFKMAISSDIQFAFSEYGKCRWDMYKKHKEEYLKWISNSSEVNNGN